ncbi:MAG: class I SAM-dependent methyltransferase [Candidatus Hydrogenedentes bacterium]|nr:class I SAM-dependent methyltransferase [Candidatus Hydrogenedentota bacterium]
MDVTQRFSNRVDNYVKYRPGYPAALLDYLALHAGIGPDTPVADIGSGTGIFSKSLLGRGCRVFAVEPNDAMRHTAERLLQDDPDFVSVDGSAELTTLADASVDLVVAAQAFHWFDPDKTRREWLRILRAGGKAALIWNDRKTDSTPFLAEYDELLRTLGTDYEKVNHRNIDAARLSMFFGPAGFTETVFQNQQRFDWDGLYGRAMSSSYVPAEGEPGYAAFADGLRALFDRHATENGVAIDYDTRLFLGSLEAAY